VAARFRKGGSRRAGKIKAHRKPTALLRTTGVGKRQRTLSNGLILQVRRHVGGLTCDNVLGSTSSSCTTTCDHSEGLDLISTGSGRVRALRKPGSAPGNFCAFTGAIRQALASDSGW
jgi:hypothetical protein